VFSLLSCIVVYCAAFKHRNATVSLIMTATFADHEQGTPKYLRLASSLFVYTAAGILGLGGCFLLFTSTSYERVLRQPDLIFSIISNRTVFEIAGAIQLVIAGYLFFGRNLITKIVIILWIGLNHLVYREATIFLPSGKGVFPPALLISRHIGVTPKTLDTFWKLFIMYLLIGGLFQIFKESRDKIRRRKIAFVGEWQRKRDVEKSGNRQPLAQGQPKKDASSEGARPLNDGISQPLRFACPDCGQHFQCDPAYRKIRITCDNCGGEIVVP